jgi:hypothetical protein
MDGYSTPSGWSWGCVSAVDPKGERSSLLRHIAMMESVFVVRADEKLSAFLELERITHELAVSALLVDDGN